MISYQIKNKNKNMNGVISNNLSNSGLFFNRLITESYFDVRAISNSLMKIYEEDFKQFVDIWINKESMKSPDKDELIFGSIVDILLTKPGEFTSNYIVYDGDYPTGLKMKFIKFFINLRTLDTFSPEEKIIDLAYQDLQSDNDGKKLRDSKEVYIEVLKKYKDLILKIFKAKKDSKEIVSRKVYEHCKSLVEAGKTHKYLSPIINIESTSDVEVIYQHEIYYNYHSTNGVIIPIKVMLDKVIINHKTKKVIPIDFKTTFQAYRFEKSIIDFKYYRQGALYTFVMKEWMNFKGIGDYDLQPFSFLALDKTNNDIFMWYLSKNDLSVASFGGYSKSGYKVKGFIEILSDIAEQTLLNDWSYPLEVLKNKFFMPTNLFKDESK